jgi:hypothetical protein
VTDIRPATRKQYSAEEKVRVVLDALRGEVTIAELHRQEGIADAIYPTKRAVDNVSQHKGMNSALGVVDDVKKDVGHRAYVAVDEVGGPRVETIVRRRHVERKPILFNLPNRHY